MTTNSTDPDASLELRYPGEELDAMAEATNYYRWISARFAPHLGSRVVEVGAGIGTFSTHLLAVAPDARLELIEPASDNVAALRERMHGEARVTVRHGYLDARAPEKDASSIVAVNVLEHVPDDERWLHDAHRVLAPGGRLLLFVPALPRIYGTLDLAFQHHRRYTRGSLRAKLHASGFRVDELSYFNLPGLLGWWLYGVVLRRRNLVPRDVRLYDRVVVPLVRKVESRWPAPLGQSLLAVATRAERTR